MPPTRPGNTAVSMPLCFLDNDLRFLVRFSATPAFRYHIICALLYKVQGLTLAALIIMLNKETARHDLATLYVGISRVTRLRDLKIWPIDCDSDRAIKHLLRIKRPPFIQVWRKGYNNKGRWTQVRLAYTKHRRDVELLDALGDPGDLKAKTVDELKKLNLPAGVDITIKI